MSTSPSQTILVVSNQALFPPTPVSTTFTLASPIRAAKYSADPSVCFTNCLTLRQGANSASTANVTRMRISIKLRCQTIARLYKNKDTGLKTGRYKTLGGGASHALGAALGDVAVGFVPAHRALQRCGDRPRLKSKFTLGARAIHKHHVPGDLHAFDWYALFAPDQPRKSRTRIGYTQR